jgi:hypothetical protein
MAHFDLFVAFTTEEIPQKNLLVHFSLGAFQILTHLYQYPNKTAKKKGKSANSP